MINMNNAQVNYKIQKFKKYISNEVIYYKSIIN